MAEKMAQETGGVLTYFATGVSTDHEMAIRIEKHQRDRQTAKQPWRTIEHSTRIETAAPQIGSNDIILLDCVTTLLNNELFSEQDVWDEKFLKKVKRTILTGIHCIKSRAKAMIVVSNEVLNEPIFGNELVFTYARLLGQIHQHLVKEADHAYLIEAGIPILMKGAEK